MADNIGMGRLWAGIHWRSDHEAGMKLGRTVACLVLQQLVRMESKLKHGFTLCPPDRPGLANQCDLDEKISGCDENQMPPTREELEKESEERRKTCNSPFVHTPLPPVKVPGRCPPPPAPIEDRYDSNRGVQRGSR